MKIISSICLLVSLLLCWLPASIPINYLAGVFIGASLGIDTALIAARRTPQAQRESDAP